MRFFKNSVHRWDVQTFLWFIRINQRALVQRLVYWTSKSGDGYLYALAGLVLPLVIPEPGRQLLVIALVAYAIELPLYFLLKKSIRRARPFRILKEVKSFIVPSDEFSFPSGHTAAAFLFATITSTVFPVVAPFLFGWATLIGLSRVFLGVHYPTDIFAGMALGVSSGFTGVWLVG